MARATSAAMRLTISFGVPTGATSPFHYFADHNEQLAPLVRKGRGEFMKQFPSVACDEMRDCLPDPADRNAGEGTGQQYRRWWIPGRWSHDWRTGWSHDWLHRWSHKSGNKRATAVPCSWQATASDHRVPPRCRLCNSLA